MVFNHYRIWRKNQAVEVAVLNWTNCECWWPLLRFSFGFLYIIPRANFSFMYTFFLYCKARSFVLKSLTPTFGLFWNLSFFHWALLQYRAPSWGYTHGQRAFSFSTSPLIPARGLREKKKKERTRKVSLRASFNQLVTSKKLLYLPRALS